MPETDFEKERRTLKELEGKNVANYKVLLTAFIQTTMENVRAMVILSAAGIGLAVVILLFGRACCGWKMIVAVGAFVGFFTSLMLSLGILERNARYLAQSLKSGSEQGLDLENCSKGGRQLFFIGCLCLIALGLLPFSGLKGQCNMMGKKDCPLGWGISKKAPEAGTTEAATPASVKDSAETVKASSISSQTVQASIVQDPTKSSVAKDSMANVSKTIGAQDVQKPSKNAGNSGNFRGGAAY